jgi:hypothetical protein
MMLEIFYPIMLAAGLFLISSVVKRIVATYKKRPATWRDQGRKMPIFVVK